jgi:hypothetical protein
MQSDSIQAGPPPGLPPVAPPSGKFIVQLFMVPGLIVGLIVCVLLVFTWLVSGGRSPQAFLDKLDSNNFEIRRRAALNLAYVLEMDEQLADNAGFAFDLADRTSRMHDESAPDEKALADRWTSLKPEQCVAESERLRNDRFYLRYLCACLGKFRVPAGLAVLRQIAEQQSGMEPAALSSLRRQAIWALADLGQNLERFDEAKPPDQELILAGLERVATSTPARDEAAAKLKDQLNDRRKGRPGALGVDVTLAKCAQADDPFLRELAALALTFWQGTPAENQRIEETLLKLAHDDGHGQMLFEPDPNKPDEKPAGLASNPGLHVRNNAIVALANRGSAKTPLDQLGEMLSGEHLRELCVVEGPDGVKRVDEAFVVQTQVAALQALARLHHKQPALDLSSLRETVTKLASDPNADVRMRAKAVLKELAG